MASKLYSEPSSILKGKEILILEDDTFLNKRLVAMLENCGAEVTLCEEVLSLIPI